MEQQQMKTEQQNSHQEVQDSLEADRFVVHDVLKKTASHKASFCDTLSEASISKDKEGLIKKIAILEVEIANLERYLLSLYRKSFNERVLLCLPESDGLANHPLSDKFLPPPDSQKENSSDTSIPVIQESNVTLSHEKTMNECKNSPGRAILCDSGIYRCQSSMSQHSFESFQMKSTIGAGDSFRSLPLSMLEYDDLNGADLGDQLQIYDCNVETPNLLAEKMIKCIATIYCEFADPPLMSRDYHPSGPSPIALSPSADEFSSSSSSVDKPFHSRESREFSGSYCRFVKVEGISMDGEKLRDVQSKLEQFKSLVGRLEEVDPKKMKDEEKLAFWINVHNSLIMHAYLVYGIPKNKKKRMSLILKAAYNVGGRSVNIDMIQSSILGCRLHRPGQWLQWRFSCKTRIKFNEATKAYSIVKPEPRLYFALCSGSYSDPVVRAYTPKSVYEDLEAAKQEYLQSFCIFQKEKKFLLPRLVETFAKNSDLCAAKVVETMELLLPDSFRKNIRDCSYRKLGKSIQWIPHNFAFRYLLLKDLVC